MRRAGLAESSSTHELYDQRNESRRVALGVDMSFSSAFRRPRGWSGLQAGEGAQGGRRLKGKQTGKARAAAMIYESFSF